MSEVCSERTPLHASFTPTSPVLTRITLPSSSAGMPHRFNVSDAMKATTRIRPCTIGAYVLMPDHLHAFVALDAERVNLSALMKSLKNVLSKKLRERGVAPPHWQKGFFDHVLRSQESAGQKWKYVRENPVRTGLVEHSSEWRYLGEIFALDYRVERL